MNVRVGYYTEEQFIRAVGGTVEDELTGTFEPIITAGAVGQYWRGDKSWQALNKAAVGLGSADNTSDLDKPISTATQTALNAKLASASYTAADVLAKLLTVDGPGSGLDADTLDGVNGAALQNSIDAAGHGAFAMPLSGIYHDAAQASYAAAATALMASGRLQLAPWTPDFDITPDTIGINVTTNVVGNAKVVIYEAGASGWPTTLLVETADLDTNVIGYRSAAYTTTFQAGRIYWIGARFSAAPTVSVIPQTCLRPLGRTAPTANPALAINAALAYATPATNPFVMNSAFLVNPAPPAAFIHEP